MDCLYTSLLKTCAVHYRVIPNYILYSNRRVKKHVKDTTEIKALLQLLDDPDDEVFETISNKILRYGKDIIPNLEQVWEHTTDSVTQERIETIIHKVNFNSVHEHFEAWFAMKKPALLVGALNLCRFKYPELNEEPVRKFIKSIYQSCWLELNNYLTPLEQITIINSIFYSMYKLTGYGLEVNKPSHFFINQVVDSRSGNNYSLGIMYSILCELLDIPVYLVQLPRQCLLAYFDTLPDYFNLESEPILKIQFYIDPTNGTIFTQNDVQAYLKKYEFETDESTFLPLDNKAVIAHSMEALSNVYDEMQEEEKIEQLQQILQLYIQSK